MLSKYNRQSGQLKQKESDRHGNDVWERVCRDGIARKYGTVCEGICRGWVIQWALPCPGSWWLPPPSWLNCGVRPLHWAWNARRHGKDGPRIRVRHCHWLLAVVPLRPPFVCRRKIPGWHFYPFFWFPLILRVSPRGFLKIWLPPPRGGAKLATPPAIEVRPVGIVLKCFRFF